MTLSFLERQKHTSLRFFLLCWSFIFLMMGNGMISLTHPDEVFYTQSAREMLEHGSWFTPYIFDAPHFEKPIFFFWLLMIVIKFFGATSFVARFWPSLFGIIGVLITYQIAWRLFHSKRVAFFSGIILSTSSIYIALSRSVLTDMVFSIWVVIALVCFLDGYASAQRKTFGIVGVFFFSGMAVLTKGILGLCFPWGIILLYLFLKRDLMFLKSWATLWGFLVFSLIVVPWHAVMTDLYGANFWQEYLHNVHFRRLWEAEHPACDTWYFYPGVMIGGMLPWSLFVIPAFFWMVHHLRTHFFQGEAYLFLGCWWLGILIFVQPAHSKLASYIFPLFPALAIMVARFFEDVLQKTSGPQAKSFIIMGWIFAIGLMSGVFVGIYFAAKYIEFVMDMRPVYVLACLVFILAMSLAALIRQRQLQRSMTLIPGFSIALLIFLYLGRSYAEPWVSCKQISQIFQKLDQSDTVVLASKFYVRGVRFYTQREMAVMDIVGKDFFSPHPIPFFHNDEVVYEFLQKQPVTFAIVKKSGYYDLKRIADKYQYTFTAYDMVGGKYIVKLAR
jgi:4-amino-4-deoxy-L-arabinose transferase-like glycosyltransferase